MTKLRLASVPSSCVWSRAPPPSRPPERVEGPASSASSRRSCRATSTCSNSSLCPRTTRPTRCTIREAPRFWPRSALSIAATRTASASPPSKSASATIARQHASDPRRRARPVAAPPAGQPAAVRRGEADSARAVARHRSQLQAGQRGADAGADECRGQGAG